MRLAEVFTENGPNLDVLRELVLYDICRMPEGIKLKTGVDTCVWKPSINGEFSTKSAWQAIQQQGEICSWKAWLWKTWILKKMSFFVWRAKRRAIPVDGIIQVLGIPIVSKCECCAQPKRESFHHILCEGEGAQKVWKFFAEACCIRVAHIRNWEGMMNFWWRRASLSSQVGWLQGVLPIVIS